MWPITKDLPKMVLPISETTVIDRLFEQLETDDRIETVYISTNDRFTDKNWSLSISAKALGPLPALGVSRISQR